MSDQLTIAGTDTFVRHEPTDDERAEREQLRVACDRERNRREDAFWLDVERGAWLAEAREIARRRKMTPEQRKQENARVLFEAKRDAIVGALPDVGERDDAKEVWDRVHADLAGVVAKLPDDGSEQQWNAILVGMDMGFMPIDYSDDDAE